MASRSLDDLTPPLKFLAEQFLKRAKSEGIDVLIYCTFRSSAEQDELYSQGRTKPGSIITNCRGGHSLHNNTTGGIPAAKAFDCVPLVKGKAMWASKDLYLRLAIIGKELGLKWGGEWKGKLKDSPHFELP